MLQDEDKEIERLNKSLTLRHAAWRCSCGQIRYNHETPGQAWQHEVSFHGACGYCKCDPCHCDGHGHWRY